MMADWIEGWVNPDKTLVLAQGLKPGIRKRGIYGKIT